MAWDPSAFETGSESLATSRESIHESPTDLGQLSISSLRWFSAVDDDDLKDDLKGVVGGFSAFGQPLGIRARQVQGGEGARAVTYPPSAAFL